MVRCKKDYVQKRTENGPAASVKVKMRRGRKKENCRRGLSSRVDESRVNHVLGRSWHLVALSRSISTAASATSAQCDVAPIVGLRPFRTPKTESRPVNVVREFQSIIVDL